MLVKTIKALALRKNSEAKTLRFKALTSLGTGQVERWPCMKQTPSSGCLLSICCLSLGMFVSSFFFTH